MSLFFFISPIGIAAACCTPRWRRQRFLRRRCAAMPLRFLRAAERRLFFSFFHCRRCRHVAAYEAFTPLDADAIFRRSIRRRFLMMPRRR